MAGRFPWLPRRGLSLDADSGDGGAVITRQFLVVLFIALLGFGWEQLLRSVIPLVVLDRGGGAALVGLVAGVYSLPALLLRPTIGRLVDSWHHGRLLQLGALVAAIAPTGLLLPGIALLIPVRLVQGAGWASYSVSAQAFMAKIAPAARRGAASSYYQATIAVSVLVGPGLGTWLYVTSGLVAPVVLATVLGLIALVVALRVRIPVQPGASKAESPASPPRSGLPIIRALERSALPSTVMLMTFMAAQSLFTVFAPVYAIALGEPIESLVVYYPVYGAVLTLSHLAAAPVADRFGRSVTIRLGCGLGIGGLAVAAFGGGMTTLTLGAAAYAIGVSFVSSATSALTIDRAPTGKLGSSMATYSLGYQLASGLGSLAWGALISASGFLVAFAGAIALQVLTLGVSLRFAKTSPPTGGARTDPATASEP
jgi:MFS family permease